MAYPIIDDIYGRVISWQGRLVPVDDPGCRPLFEPRDQRMAYEVIRIEEGVPLFWQDHLDRLHKSVGDRFAIPDSLYAESLELIRAESWPRANLRLVMTDTWRVIHLTPSAYPDSCLRSQGVPVGLLSWEREDPNIKVIRSDYKKAVAGRFAEPGPLGDYAELLLADRQGRLTEGSRSNLFFIRGNQVLTAPDERILLGITRRYVRAAIRTAGAELVEAMLTLDDLRDGKAEAAFITGSPIDVLAISAVEHIRLDSARHPLFLAIDQAYRGIVSDYIRLHKIARPEATDNRNTDV